MQRFVFLKLPFEIYLKIFSELDPQAIIELGKTCRTLRRIVDDRSVWLAALRHMCQQHNLLQLSFATEAMSGPDLKRAALGPILLERMLPTALHTEGHGFHSITPKAETTLVRPPDDAANFSRVFLIPGGRYLIAITDSSLMLWDLDAVTVPSGGVSPCPVVVETIHFEGDFRMSEPTIHRTTLIRFIIAIHSGKRSTHPVRLIAYEFGPLPHLRQLGELNLRLSPWKCIIPCCIHDDVAYFQAEGTFGVWNFVHGLCTSWRGPNADRLFVVQDLLVGINISSGVIAWKTPPLHEAGVEGLCMERDELTHPASLDPRWVVKYGDDLDEIQNEETTPIHLEGDIFGPSKEPEPESGSSLSFVYHLMGQSGQDPGLYNMLWRFKLEIADDLTSARLKKSGETEHVLLHPSIAGLPSSGHHSISFNHVLMVATGTSQWPELLYGRLLSEKDRDIAIKWEMAFIGVKHSTDLAKGASFCRGSGKLVYICDSKLKHGGRNGIHVVDLLSSSQV